MHATSLKTTPLAILVSLILSVTGFHVTPAEAGVFSTTAGVVSALGVAFLSHRRENARDSLDNYAVNRITELEGDLEAEKAVNEELRDELRRSRPRH